MELEGECEMIWQPIETAPRDGTKIDVWVKNFDVGAAGKLTVTDVGRHCDVKWDTSWEYYGGEIKRGEEETWVHEYSGNWIPLEYCDQRITHWQPLPDAPHD